VWITNKVSAINWPQRLHVHVLSESMTSASSVWNAMLGMWNHVKSQPGWEPVTTPHRPAGVGPFQTADLAHAGVASSAPVAPVSADAAAAPALVRISRPVLDPARAKQALADMLTLDGLLGCAVVDGTTGLVLARELREDQPVDMDLAAAACAQVLRAHRQAARSMGLSEHTEEVMTSAGARQQVLRTVSHYPELFLVVLLDKQRTNLALARFKLMEVERSLV
jgi:predicted regulator of Ras-like GTPase activity (Roadblock/LC7/MglB family)